MKITLSLLFVLFCFCGTAQKNKPIEKYFIVLYTLGENWDTTKQYCEQQYFEQHSNT